MARTSFGGVAPASGSQFLRRCYSANAAAQEETPVLSVQDMMPVENIRNIAIIGKDLNSLCAYPLLPGDCWRDILATLCRSINFFCNLALTSIFFLAMATVAHVDHGKTSLVDKLLAQSGEALGSTRVMDSNTLEKERGITILSKVTSVVYNTTDNRPMKINIVGTSSHHWKNVECIYS